MWEFAESLERVEGSCDLEGWFRQPVHSTMQNLNDTTTISSLSSEAPPDPCLQSFPDEIREMLVGLYIPVVIVSLIANAIIVITFAAYSKMRTVSNLFVVVLSIADGILTIFVGVTATVQLLRNTEEDNIWCTFSSYFSTMSIMASYFSVLLICIHRSVSPLQTLLSLPPRTHRYRHRQHSMHVPDLVQKVVNE